MSAKCDRCFHCSTAETVIHRYVSCSIDVRPGDYSYLVDSAVSDPAVKKWRQRGTIWLWRYREERKDYRGWHMSADREGRSSLIELLDVFKRAKWSCQRFVCVAQPPDAVLRVPGEWAGSERTRSPDKLSLRFPKDRVPDGFWSLTLQNEVAVLAFGRGKLEALSAAIAGIERREGDYTLGPDDTSRELREQQLWFWS